jgi:hypothetical protein
MNKFDVFEATVQNINPDVIGITESWSDVGVCRAGVDGIHYVSSG